VSALVEELAPEVLPVVPWFCMVWSVDAPGVVVLVSGVWAYARPMAPTTAAAATTDARGLDALMVYSYGHAHHRQSGW
jgi:hypothetical protein